MKTRILMNRSTKTPTKPFPIETVMETLRGIVARWPAPSVTGYAQRRADPFKILISTLLSLRTQDKTTVEATDRLFALARTPEDMLRLTAEQIERAIHPVLYFRNKTAAIREICRKLLDDCGGRVPDEIDELLKFKGVGRKTANLVVILAYHKPGICVDTHVHRVVNRWGFCQTRTPEATELCLRERLPQQYWMVINSWLVVFGQRVCQPVSPWCSQCRLRTWCARVGVARSR